MGLALGKVTLVLDGPAVLLHGLPLIARLQQAGFDVTVCAAGGASVYLTQFAPALLSGHPVVSWPLPDVVLEQKGIVLFADASIDFITQALESAAGSSLLASGCRVLVAPGMLPGSSDDALASLAKPGVTVLAPREDRLSLGSLGVVRIASMERCIEACMRQITPQELLGVRILVTAGPTAEDLDPVRFLTNRSTGRMGVSLARMAARKGAIVTLVHGPMSWPVPDDDGITAIPVRSAQNMYDAVMAEMTRQDVAILCAAVADFKPVTYSEKKIKKGKDSLSSLLLGRTADILASIGSLEKRPFLVGFAAESNDVASNAQVKLQSKHCDMICANDVTEAGSGFAVGTNRVTVFHRDGSVSALPQMSKDDVARKILSMVAERLAENVKQQ